MSEPSTFAVPAKPATSGLRGWWRVLGYICLAIFACVVVFAAVHQYRFEMARAHRVQCHNSLRMLSLALQNYQKLYGDWPPACSYDASGQPEESWRTAILRYWEPDINPREFSGATPYLFCCPADGAASQQGFTSYVAVIDRHEATRRAGAPVREGPRIKFIVEIANSGIKWSTPRDLDESEWEALLTRVRNPSKHPAGYHILYRDGRIEFVSCAAR